ncbi:cardiolipin synthase [Acrasis kona]|uniref:Cardiolipin synthase n=1 Tax=Acrasis kona TaxID=1008807 RepID=A0AAW2YLW0_9EUKA
MNITTLYTNKSGEFDLSKPKILEGRISEDLYSSTITKCNNEWRQTIEGSRVLRVALYTLMSLVVMLIVIGIVCLIAFGELLTNKNIYYPVSLAPFLLVIVLLPFIAFLTYTIMARRRYCEQRIAEHLEEQNQNTSLRFDLEDGPCIVVTTKSSEQGQLYQGSAKYYV